MSTLQKEKKDKFFRWLILICAFFVPIVLILIFLTLLQGFSPALKEFGFHFFINSDWDPVRDKFGSGVFLFGTFATTLMSLIFALPFSIAISLTVGEIIRGTRMAYFISSAVEIISAVPSVIIGFWGIAVLVPWMIKLQNFLGFTPYGTGFLTASLVLSFMIIPFSASLGREVIMLVPKEYKEAAYSLGATRYEVIRKVILPYVSSGMVGGFFLAAGRAIGETMAVTMLIGNVNFIPDNLFSPTNTMSSVIANEFAEATSVIHISSLYGVGLVLLIFTVITTSVGKWVIDKLTF